MGPVEARHDTSRLKLLSGAGLAVLCLILVVSAVLRAIRINELPSGYLVFNEGYYLDLAIKQLSKGSLDWFFNPGLYDKPPLYVGILVTLFRMHLPEIAAARSVSVLSGIASILATFVMGRLLYNERIGLVAAAMLGVMPGAVLVDHNIQVDSLFIALMLLGVCGYLVSARTQSLRDAVLGGGLLGLAILTKQPAVLALVCLAIWETWRTGSLAWAKEPRSLAFAAASVGVGASWYLIELALGPSRMIGPMMGHVTRWDMTPTFWPWFMSSVSWMVFPLTALVAVAGLASALAKRKAGDKLLLVFVGIFALYFVAFHFHAYYLLPMAPFFALAVARTVVGGIQRDRVAFSVRMGLVGVLALSMVLASVEMLEQKKWGRASPLTLSAPTQLPEGKTWLYVSPAADGFFGPTPSLVDPSRPVSVLDANGYSALPADEASGTLLLDWTLIGPSGAPVSEEARLQDTLVEPVFFGWELDWAREDADALNQEFINEHWVIRHVGKPWEFGVIRRPSPYGWPLYGPRSFHS